MADITRAESGGSGGAGATPRDGVTGSMSGETAGVGVQARPDVIMAKFEDGRTDSQVSKPDLRYREATACELSLCLKVFPTARHNHDIEDAVWDTLSHKGWNGSNTLFAHSTCPDEVNYDCPDTDLVNLMHRRWGEKFTLGGLAGMPFCGRTGWAAFSSHTPKNGNVVILFAPHTGIGADGTIGRLQRKGQDSETTCCGAAVAASNSTAPPSEIAEYDLQQSVLTAHVHVRKQDIAEHASGNKMLGLVYTNYEIVRHYLQQILVDPEKHCKEVAVVGGIMVNLPPGIDDRFVPLDFEVFNTQTGKVESYTEKFRGHGCATLAGCDLWKAPRYGPFFEPTHGSKHRDSMIMRKSMAPPSVQRKIRYAPESQRNSPPRTPPHSPGRLGSSANLAKMHRERPAHRGGRGAGPHAPCRSDTMSTHISLPLRLSTDRDGRVSRSSPPQAVTVALAPAKEEEDGKDGDAGQPGQALYLVRVVEAGGTERTLERPFGSFTALKGMLAACCPKAESVRAPFPKSNRCSSPGRNGPGSPQVSARQNGTPAVTNIRTASPPPRLGGYATPARTAGGRSAGKTIDRYASGSRTLAPASAAVPRRPTPTARATPPVSARGTPPVSARGHNKWTAAAAGTDVRRRQLESWLAEVVRTCWPNYAVAGFLGFDSEAHKPQGTSAAPSSPVSPGGVGGPRSRCT